MVSRPTEPSRHPESPDTPARFRGGYVPGETAVGVYPVGPDGRTLGQFIRRRSPIALLAVAALLMSAEEQFDRSSP